jgi:putative oxidoreductase
MNGRQGIAAPLAGYHDGWRSGRKPLSALPEGFRIMSDLTHVLGRVLVSAVFLVFGVLQFTHIGNYIVNPAVMKFSTTIGGMLTPTVIAYLVAAIDLFGGVLILVGFQTRSTAIVLIAFVVLTIIFAHPFWTMDGPARAANQVQFYKNLSIISALLFLILLGSGRYSLDKRFSRS